LCLLLGLLLSSTLLSRRLLHGTNFGLLLRQRVWHSLTLLTPLSLSSLLKGHS